MPPPSPRTRALLALTLTLALGGCGGSGGDRLEFRRADGSLLEFHGETFIWCAPVGDDDPSRGDALYIVAGGLGRAAVEAGWSLFVPLRDVRAGRPIPFPDERLGHPILFAHVPPVVEASSSEEESSGRLTFDRLTCEQGEEVSFSVSAMLGSEFHEGEPIRVEGSFHGEVGTAPEEPRS